MKHITTKHIKGEYSEIEEPIILDETPLTRTVLKCAFAPSGVRGKIWRQKKNSDGTFSNINEIDFRKEDENYGIMIDIPTEGLKSLARDLYTFFKLRKEYGVEFGEHKFITGKEDEIVKIIDVKKGEVIKELINKGYSDEFFDKLSDLKPESFKRFSKAAIQEQRESDIQEFESSLLENSDERYWQKFFENKKWIFGYGLNYLILKPVQSQPHYGGTRYTGKESERGDYLTSTEGYNKYTVLVEIKTPFTKLLKGKEPHHSGAWSLSNELTDALTQLQANVDTWNTDGSNRKENVEELFSQRVYTVNPKGILVIGNQEELLDNPDKRETFQRFRSSITGIEIITFDELLARANFITKD